MAASKENSLILRKYVPGTIYDLKNLALKQITCASPKLFNDPIDTYFYYSGDGCFSKYKEILTTEIMDTIRISSFINYSQVIKEKNNTNKLKSNEILMWTHYANAHKGFCFEYQINIKDFAILDSGKFDDNKHILHQVSYMENLATEFETLFSVDQVPNYTNENYEDLLKSCFFTKDQAFEYENEIRFLLYTHDKSSRINFPFNYLKKIIFGERCERDMKILVSHINDQVYKSDIELYEINDKFQEVKYERD